MKAPVNYTCPDIDICIAWLKTSKDHILAAINCIDSEWDAYDLQKHLDEAYKYCDIAKELEELRASNSALRDWGYELANELEKLKREL
jgi:hypothetical protein